MVLLAYSIATVALLLWLSVCFIFAILWVVRRIGVMMNSGGRGFAALTIVALSLALMGLAIANLVETAGPAPGAASINQAHINSVARDAHSLKAFADPPEPKAPAAGARASGLWSNSAFHEAITTLWQAPLLVLAIVLSVAALIGWQGYSEIKEKVAKDIETRFANETEIYRARIALYLVKQLNDLSFDFWTLSTYMTKGNMLPAPDEIPPDSLDQSAFGHVTMAVDIDEMAWTRLEQVTAPRYPTGLTPKQLKDWQEIQGLKEFYQMQAKQNWSYHQATCSVAALPLGLCPTVEQWRKVLDRSRAVLRVVETESGQSDTETRNRINDWLDTFLYVRVMLAIALLRGKIGPGATSKELADLRQTAIVEYEDARKHFEKLHARPGFEPVDNRFKRFFP